MENLFARPLSDLEFHETFRRYAKEDGVDLDAMSPYANIATLPSLRRAQGEALRRAFTEQPPTVMPAGYVDPYAAANLWRPICAPSSPPTVAVRSWWRRLLRLPA